MTTLFANAGTHTDRVDKQPASSRFANARLAVWNFMVEVGRRRGRAELLRVADRYAIAQPELAAQLRAAACAPERRPTA